MAVATRLTGLAVSLLMLSPWLNAQGCCKDANQICVCGVGGAPGRTVGPNDVFVVRLGTLAREPVRAGVLLGAGDELTGTAPGVVVEVGCPKGSSVKFSDAFRTVLLPPAGSQDCSFSLLSGSVDILAGAPTQVLAGLVVMGSKRTQYTLRVYREEGTARLETMVYEGEARCQVIPRNAGFDMQSGSKAVIRGDAWQRTDMSNRDIERTASVYARMDVAMAQSAGFAVESPLSVYESMKAWHAKVLTAPAEWQPRLTLATRQLNLGNPRQSLYHLRKIAEAAESNPRLRAEVALIQGIAYQRAGDEREAARHFELSKKIDPQLNRRTVEERYQLGRGGNR